MKPERMKEEMAKIEKEFQEASAQVEALMRRKEQLIGAHSVLKNMLAEAEAEVESIAVEEPKSEEAADGSAGEDTQ